MDVKNALSMLEMHVSKHSNNKYQNSIMDSEAALKQPVFTLFTSSKYMVRYLANVGEKRAQIEDLLKSAHFILFEIQNRLNQEVEKSHEAVCECDNCGHIYKHNYAYESSDGNICPSCSSSKTRLLAKISV